MAIKTTSLTLPPPARTPPLATEDYDSAARAQALADLLAKQASTPMQVMPERRGNAVAKGFTQLAQAMLAARQQGRATAAKSAADSGLRGINDELARAIAPTQPGTEVGGVGESEPFRLTAQKISPVSGKPVSDQALGLTQALAGQDPRLANQLLAQMRMGQVAPVPPPTPMTEFQSATLAQGSDKAKEDRAARLQELQLRLSDQRLTAQEQANLRREIAAMQSETARRGQDTQRDIADAKATAKPKLSATGQTAAIAKKADTQVLLGQIANLKKYRAALNQTTDTGYVIGGRQHVTQAAEQYDKALDAIRTSVRKITRTPGEGSMSNWEGQLAQAQLPTRDVFNIETLDQGIEQLDALANGYHNLTSEMLGETPAAAAAPAAAPAAPPAAQERKSIGGKNYVKENGQWFEE